MFSSAVSVGTRFEALEDEAHLGAPQLREAIVGEAGEVLAADPHGAGRRDVEARQQVHEGGLAGARRPHHGEELAARDVDVDAAQGVDGRVAVAVAAAEPGAADGRAGGHGRGGRDVEGGLEHVIAPPGSGFVIDAAMLARRPGRVVGLPGEIPLLSG